MRRQRSENAADGMVDSVVEQILAAAAVDPAPYERAALRQGSEATQDCAQACLACADACLGEEMVEELTGAIRTLSNTADVCEVTARVLLRRSGPDDVSTRALLAACWSACHRAAQVCEEFLPIHDHCRVCARACRTAERACRVLLFPASTELRATDQAASDQPGDGRLTTGPRSRSR